MMSVEEQVTKWSRIAFEQFRLLAVLAFAASATFVLVPGTSAAFGVGSIVGSYGCLGRTGGLVDSGGTIGGISELMRLVFDGAGHVKGTILLGLEGEVCNISASGTYGIQGGGLGTLDLTWNTITATGDADGDADCAGLTAGPLSQHTALVVESGGSAFDLQAEDDFVTSPTAAADTISLLADTTNPFVGTCKKQ
jgi:hypothetical protein